jgi:hypothetical protein
MSLTETVFFAAAFLIPLVGGGSLLYFLSKDAKSKRDDGPKKE